MTYDEVRPHLNRTRSISIKHENTIDIVHGILRWRSDHGLVIEGGTPGYAGRLIKPEVIVAINAR